MQFYPEDYDVTIDVSLVNPAGVIEPGVTVSAALLDQNGDEVMNLGAKAVGPGDTEISILIARTHLRLAPGVIREARILEVTLEFAGGTVKRRSSFGIEREQQIVMMKNSFMTYEIAQIISVDFTNATGWLVGDDNMRRAALSEAFLRLTRIPMRYVPRNADGYVINTNGCSIPRDTWHTLDRMAFDAFPDDFKTALRTAQFLEADAILRGDQVLAKRREGILSETIGESQVKLAGTVAEYGVGSETLAALAGYVDFNMRVRRS